MLGMRSLYSILCISLFFLCHGLSSAISGLGMLIRRVVNVSLGVLIAYLSVPVVMNLLSSRQVMNTSFDPLRIVNTYGAFGRYAIHLCLSSIACRTVINLCFINLINNLKMAFEPLNKSLCTQCH